MRIVAGRFSSRRLDTLSGDATRPTLDKVREAVFSSLGGFFQGGAILDLYAGSGAIGLEALSRGMEQAVFVDKSKAACAVIRKNIETLQVQQETLVLPVSDMKALPILAERGMKFDLVYLDPPYRKERNAEIIAALRENDLLAHGARIVIESLKEDQYDEIICGMRKYREAVYGITKISYYREEDNESMLSGNV